MMPIGGHTKMETFVRLYPDSDNMMRVEFIPRVTMIVASGKHFQQGILSSMWIYDDGDLPPTFDDIAWEYCLGIPLKEFSEGENPDVYTYRN